MAAFTKASSMGLFKLFVYSDQIKWRPHNLTLDPSSRDIIDNVAAPSLDFAYLVCRRPVLIYRSKKKIRAEIYCSARFCRQFGIINYSRDSRLDLPRQNIFYRSEHTLARVYASLHWLYPEGSGTSFRVKCYSFLCTLVAEGRRGHVHSRTYIRVVDRIKKEGTIFRLCVDWRPTAIWESSFLPG